MSCAIAARVSGRQTPVEVQLTPDAKRLLIIAPAEVADDLVALIEELDQSEPTITQGYRPRFFSAEDVAGLIEQILQNEGGGDQKRLHAVVSSTRIRRWRAKATEQGRRRQRLLQA